MNKITVGLEKLNASTDEQVIDIVGLEDLAEVMVVTDELNAAMAEIDTEMAEFDVMFQAFDEMETMLSVIEDHGLSKGMALLIDPDQQLPELIGFPAAESLDVNPVKDANAQVATEALKDNLKKYADGVVKFFKMILDKIKAAMGKVVAFFTAYEKQVVKMNEAMKGLELDDAKVKEKTFKLVAAPDLSKAVKGLPGALSKLLGPLEGSKAETEEDLKDLVGKLDAGALKVLGLKVAESGKGFDKDEDGWKKEEGDLKKLGYDPKTITSMTGDVKALVSKIKSGGAEVKAIQKTQASAIAALKAEGKASEADVKKQVSVMKTIAGLIVKLNTANVTKSKAAIGAWIAAGNAVKSCSK